MPSQVYISPALARNKLALIEDSVQEQLNGALNYSVTYTTTARLLEEVRALFFIDAAPPVAPSSIKLPQCLTGRLYLQDHGITQANGLAHISARYVGGILKTRWPGYKVNREHEYFTLNVYRFQKTSIGYELVEIGGQTQQVAIVPPSRSDLLRFVGFSRQYFSQNLSVTTDTEQSYLRFVEGAISETITRNFLTPTVAIKTITYAIED
jgi:hypothetical protein